MTISSRPPRSRRIVHSLSCLVSLALLATLLAGVTGHFLRDRLPVLHLLMYAPLLPTGLAAVGWDGIQWGRSLPRVRFALAALGSIAACFSAFTTYGFRPPTAPDAPGGGGLTVLQWNIRWGGGGGGVDGSEDRLASIRADIARRAPDIVVLSEAPSSDALASLDGMAFVQSQHRKGDPYLYRLVVASRWPVVLEREEAIPSGRIMRARVAAPGGDVRVLVVDGQSHPLIDRTPRLRAVAQLLREAEAAGQPIDLIAGDFNAVPRSIGFDAIAAAGFASVSDVHCGWHATWPSICPLYEIDHVWVGGRWSPAGVERFTNLATDHRGIVARLTRRTDGADSRGGVRR